MEDVTVNKDEVLSILKKNRAEHRKIFLEAVDGYKKQAISMLEDHIKNIKSGKVPQVHVVLPQPTDYTKEYDCAIKMLEMSVDKNVTLSHQTFQQYIMDDWSWKRQFLASNSDYSGTATALLAQ